MNDLPVRASDKRSRAHKQPTKPIDLLERSAQVLEEGLDGLHTAIKTVKADLATKYSSALASHLAYLTKHATSALAEARKQDKEQRIADQSISDEKLDALIVVTLGEMSRERRFAIKAQLDEMVGGDHLLAH